MVRIDGIDVLELVDMMQSVAGIASFEVVQWVLGRAGSSLRIDAFRRALEE